MFEYFMWHINNVKCHGMDIWDKPANSETTALHFPKTSKTSAAIGTYIPCSGPFFTLHLVRYFDPEFVTADFLDKIVNILPPMKSACNPILYACLDNNYRCSLYYTSLVEWYKVPYCNTTHWRSQCISWLIASSKTIDSLAQLKLFFSNILSLIFGNNWITNNWINKQLD